MRVIGMTPVVTPLPREIFILAGESDMSGRGALVDVPSFSHAGRVKVFSNAWSWVGGAEPVDSAVGQVDTVSSDGSSATASPGMSFGSSLAGLRPGIEVGLVPCARGGSRLTDWERNLSRSTLYGSMIARAQYAASTGTVRGVLWMQGKNGASDEAEVDAWSDNCYALIADIRSDLGIADLPFIVTVVNSYPGGAYISDVQDAQLAMSGTGIAVVDARDLPDQGDSARHLTTAGLVTLGQRYATAMDGLLD